MNINTLQVGDLIVRKKGPLSRHFMVYVGIHNGIEIVAENQSGIGVRFTSLANALSGNPIIHFEKFGGTEAERYLVIPRIKKLLGKSYDLVVFNCEHFARWIASGKTESKQVKIVSAFAFAGGAAMLVNKNSTIKILGFLLIAGAALGFISQKEN